MNEAATVKSIIESKDPDFIAGWLIELRTRISAGLEADLNRQAIGLILHKISEDMSEKVTAIVTERTGNSWLPTLEIISG